MSFNKLLMKNKRICLENRFLIKSLDKNKTILYEKIKKYFDKYCNYYSLDIEFISSTIDKISDEYSSNLKEFIATGKYPFQNGVSRSITRIEYDIFMTTSCLFTKHRFQVMWEVYNFLSSLATPQKTACIGAGSGIDLLLSNNHHKIDAFDLSFSDFLKNEFKNTNFIENPFIKNDCAYDLVIAIEILEHISAPYNLIEKISDSLKNNAYAFLTIAINVPQFDHIVNFIPSTFEKKLVDYNLKVVDKKIISHNYHFYKTDSCNIMYVVKNLNENP